MKKIKLPDPFKIRARMEKKENKLMETMELLQESHQRPHLYDGWNTV